MQNSVLTLGEKIVLAARLASIEHVRQEIADIARREQQQGEAISVGDRMVGFMDEPETLARPVPELLGEVFRRLEASDPTLQRTITAKPAGKIAPRPRKRGAA